jgi:hypothetical protein
VAITHVDNNTATNGSGTSVTVTKPSSTTSGDLLLAFFTSNNQNCTPPAGWTEIADETIEVFRNQVFYKVAGGSEPANYTFSVGSSTVLVCSISAFRGIEDTDAIDIDPVFESDTSHSEPYTTPALTGGTSGRLIYFRAVRNDSTTVRTFTASGVTELSDVGVAGSSVSYASGLYMASADYSGSGAKSGLAITCSGAETHNFVLTLAIKSDFGVTGTLAANMPSLPTVSMDGNWAYAAVVDVDMPAIPTMDSTAFVGATEGTLDVFPGPTVNLAGNTPPLAEVDVVVMPTVDVVGETRFFGGNSIIPEREERWFIITQHDYRLGVRFGVDLPMRVEMPLPDVDIDVTTASRAGQVEDVPAEAFEPTETIVIFSGGTTDVTAVAEDATVLSGCLAFAETTTVDCFGDPPESIGAVIEAETVVAAGGASDVIGASVLVPDVSAVAVAYDVVTGAAKQADAEHVSVGVVANAPQSGVANANAGHAAVSVTANQGTERVTFSPGHASINCHN